jgi:low affinity Fe/Cu permease
MPSDVSHQVGLFDRFAKGASVFFSRTPFFAFCVLLVVVWAPTYFLIRDADEWQLIIHTITTIITFLMVALLQNNETRADLAIQGKLNAIADALSHLMEQEGDGSETVRRHVHELRKAVGLEEIESSDTRRA